MSRFHVLLVVMACFLTAGCAARSSSAVTRTYLEAKAIDYHRTQEARVHAVGLRLLSHIQNPPTSPLSLKQANQRSMLGPRGERSC